MSPAPRETPFAAETSITDRPGSTSSTASPAISPLNATINPDFGQVEVDPAVVNLSVFETFFPEKRPFFVEGADVFRFGGIRASNSFGVPDIFFSRRIGREPQRSVGGDG